MKYYSFFVLLFCCANIAAQSSSYYIRSSNGSVRVKKENEEKWRECSVSTIQQIELGDSVVANDDSEFVIIRQNGSIKSVVSPVLSGKRLLDDVMRDEDSNSGNAVAASNRRVYSEVEREKGGSPYAIAKMSMRGTLTDVQQVDSLVSTVKAMLTKGTMSTASPVSATIIRDNAKGDYIRLKNTSDKVYHINVLVRKEDGTLNSLYSDITEEITTIENTTFPFIAVPAKGEIDLDMWRFFELPQLRLILVVTEDSYNIVLFNALLAEESEAPESQTMAEKIFISTAE